MNRSRFLQPGMRINFVLVVICLLATVPAKAIDIVLPSVGLQNLPLEIGVSGVVSDQALSIQVNDRRYGTRADAKGQATLEIPALPATGMVQIVVTAGEHSASAQLRALPGWVSLLPPFVAIALALLIRNVVVALLVGLWLGATALHAFSPLGALRGLMDTFERFILDALNNEGHLAIILFTMMIGGMVGIITRNGGMSSIVNAIARRTRTAVGGQLAVWLMGLMIFFDDYANTLVVGNTARPITDRLKISREKLAYLVDSTAAPVVCLALFTTWIGYEVSLIDAALASMPELTMPAYTIVLNSIPYSFYPILAVSFVLMVAATGRDMGPMLAAERRARMGQGLSESPGGQSVHDGDAMRAKTGAPQRAVNALLPIVILVVSLCLGLIATGSGDTFTAVIGSADPYKAMMWASFAGVLVAAVLSVGQRILSLDEVVDAWYGGARATLFGMIILILAWAMSAVTDDLNARGYLISLLGDTVPVALVPTVVFVLASITAFATGSSFGTMGILIPLVVPLAWAIMSAGGLDNPEGPEGMHVLFSAVACILAGAVWGDHCSPISDTTVLSSIASGCDHIQHVRTQRPYAFLVGFVAIAAGTIPAGLGLSPWLSIAAGTTVLFVVLRLVGRSADAPQPTP